MKMRYEIYCESDFLTAYKGPVSAGWRSHLEYTDHIQIITIGLTRDVYQKIMAPVLQAADTSAVKN